MPMHSVQCVCGNYTILAVVTMIVCVHVCVCSKINDISKEETKIFYARAER